MDQKAETPSAPPTRLQLMSGSVVAAVVSAVLAVGVSFVRFHSVKPLAVSHSSGIKQLAWGLLVGAVFGTGAVALFLRASTFAPGRARATEVLRSAHLSRVDLVLMAVSAGVGEELLFRAALQPLLGLWIGAILFTAVHYWVPLKGAARVIYGIFVFGTSLALGLLFALGGLIAAMTAHATVDLFILIIAREKLADGRG